MALLAFSWHCRKLCSFCFLPSVSLYLFHRIITTEVYFWSNFLRRKNNFKGVFQIPRGMNVWPSCFFFNWVFWPFDKFCSAVLTITSYQNNMKSKLVSVTCVSFLGKHSYFLLIISSIWIISSYFRHAWELLDLTWLNCNKDSMFKPNKSLERQLTRPQHKRFCFAFKRPGVHTKYYSALKWL